MSAVSAPIGVMDSGAGGISVLRALVAALPHEHYLYYGDSAHAPYGTRPQADIVALTLAAAEYLVAQGVKALVVACNTATGASLPTLRERLAIPVLGIQPALTAALALAGGRDVLVLATPGTFASPGYQQVKAPHAAQVRDLPCPGLMEFVERGELSGPRLQSFLTALFAPVDKAAIGAIALGCTHYPFLKDAIAPHFPGIALVDDSGRVAEQLEARLRAAGTLNPQEAKGDVTFQSSGTMEDIQRMRMLFGR